MTSPATATMRTPPNRQRRDRGKTVRSLPVTVLQCEGFLEERTQMSEPAKNDPLPAFVLFSWVFFLILAAQLVIQVPDYLAQRGCLRLARLTGDPFFLGADAAWIYAVSSIALVSLCAIAFTGYLLRTFPLPAVGSPVAPYVRSLVVCSLSGMIFPSAAWVWGGEWERGMTNGVFVWIAWLFYLWWNVQREGHLRRPFVLFLRRFGSFADLALLRSLLRLTPRGVPVVLLVGGREDEVGIWDPTSLVTFGFRAILPMAGRPLFLDGGDRWEPVMESLVKRGAVMVLDTTEESPGLRKEIETVRRLRPCLQRVIVLEEEPSKTLGRDPARGLSEHRAVSISYRRGWWTIALRLSFIAAFAAYVGYCAELPRQLAEKAAEGGSPGGLFGAIIMIGAPSLFLVFLLLRGGLTRKASRALAAALRAALIEGR